MTQTQKITAAVEVLSGRDCLTTEQAAEILECLPRNVRYYVDAGYLPRIELFGVLLLPRDEVELLAECKPRPTGRPRMKGKGAK